MTRTDLVQPDWFTDPVTGRRSDPGRYSFRIDHRSQEQTGNVKQVWEISRLQHLTLLATAWFLTREEALRRTGGEPAPLLVAGEPVPVRRALDQRHRARHPADQPGLDPAPARRLARRGRPVRGQPPGGPADPVAPAVPGRVPEPGLVGQQPRHRRGGRAARGQLRVPVVSRRASAGGVPPPRCSSASWSTTPSPPASAASSPRITRRFVAELGFLAAVEAEASGHPLSTVTWERLAALVDSAAALVDERSQPPRQGDSDEGRGLLLDAPVPNRWPTLLALGEALVGRLDWWPPSPAGAESTLAGALASGTREHPGPARDGGRLASPTPG